MHHITIHDHCNILGIYFMINTRLFECYDLYLAYCSALIFLQYNQLFQRYQRIQNLKRKRVLYGLMMN
jgi:hypothetical protein